MAKNFSLGILSFLFLLSLFPGFFSPYPYDLQFRDSPFHPPTRIHLLKEGKITFPYVKLYKLKDPLFKTYEETSLSCRLKFFTKTPYGFKFLFVERPCKLFLLGTDQLGRDVFSRLIYGTRISLLVSIVGVFTTFLIGSLVGGISGYFGGKVDNFLMRVVEVLMAIPTFYLMLSLRAIFPLEMPSFEVFLMVVFILSFLGWASLSRVVRGIVLSLREKEFVLFAKVYGAHPLFILLRHILPNTLYYIIISATLSVPSFILAEASLSFLGLGIQEPYPSLGNMLSYARDINVITNYPWMLSPGVVLFLIVLAFNLLGDYLREKML